MSRILLSASCKKGFVLGPSITSSLRSLSTTSILKTGDNEKKGLFSPESSIASKDFKNRWAMFAPAFATHICLGAPYGKFSSLVMVFFSNLTFDLSRLVCNLGKFIQGIWICSVFG